ncbi:ComEA family DNA-binding protein [Plantibacter sp. Mn2098]|uniref:ComEA family DNA-binding protein n=1 Tax=Plantibacter sp. Mn2098 TaxID=3395266 RepID=UPI003BD5609B
MDGDETLLERRLSSVAVVSRRVRGARVGVGAVVVLGLVAVAIAIVMSMFSPRGAVTTIDPTASASPGAGRGSDAGGARSGSEIFVHVLGAVNRPGLYRLDDGARGFEAIAAAGGYAEGADETSVNLARFVSDGEQLVVPLLGEEPVGGISSGASGGPGGGGSGNGGSVNLNTATAAELETLPRIGAAMAARIIEWREANGRFTAVDDLGSVAGIGEKTLEGLRPLVSV